MAAPGADQGVNGSGTLQVSLGSGSAAQPGQIAFSTTVDSPYAATTLAVWELRDTSHGIAENQGVCVLWSTLLGSGRATAALSLGGGEDVQPCLPSWWRAAGPVTVTQPRLGLAGIPRSPR